jgi:hypothetical protein
VEGHEEVPGTEEAVPCWSGYFAGSSVVEAGGSVVTHGRQLQAAVLLFQVTEREIPALPFSSIFFSPSSTTFPFLFVLVYVCFFQLPFLFLFRYSLSPLALPVLLLYLSQTLSPISSFPIFFLFFFSFGPFPFRSFLSLLSILSFLSLSVPLSCVLALGGIYREKGAGASLLPPYCCAWGAGFCCPATVPGWLASGRGWQGATPPVPHHEGAWGFWFWQSTWHEGVNEERRRKKNKTCYLPLLHVQGKNKEEQCRLKRHYSVLIFFFNMKRVVSDKTRYFI